MNETRVPTYVAVAFTIATLIVSISAGIVAFAEPGAVRVSAGAIAALLFLAAVFGFTSTGENGRVALVRRLLIFSSKTSQHSTMAIIGLAFACAAGVYFGALRTEFFLVHCLDAKRISRDSVPGRRVEECGPDRNAAFTAWFPMGREALLASVKCNYSSGDSVDLISGESSCPLHQFLYARMYDPAGIILLWQRGLDGWWQERGPTKTYSRFKEINSQPINAPGPTGSQLLSGVLVRRVPDEGNMELFIPRSISRNAWIYIRNGPTEPWRLQGTIVALQ
jgi:hypothetical protein